jgi:hypothetical protein
MSLYRNQYVFVLARGIDLLLACWIWRDYGITVSSWAGLAMRRPSPRLWARILSSVLDWLEPGHCAKAIEADIQRAQEALKILQS